ncbi:putative decaprenylphosphoryl-beta-D-ribose oxidase [Candidatus Methylomirabilis lanthanidiphila]|uniref:Putative decaprenylphosphoryl-beta-D-ribose oxidase n=1 Tax=Candidatus Methylomirabilis lanthanidiphila TaxID=2211376 RepID=A0A564ZL09_9BACT|nr:FAD-binding oxidoreductase [Candidatus Methylomirabilis lanthanidiphila]VUZ86019.1 putative decaprenylphosphoryl-beta-D-ribose oxidase [Candidatus Methylomirabilis lanthanidiphila]
MKRYESWGRYPKAKHTLIAPMGWRCEPPCFEAFAQPVLPFAQGRSYGDVCLNDGGVLIDTSPLRRFMAFDEERGILRCEAGMTLAEILKLIVPMGWFLPVTPGTKYVSVGGAIANDVHGKSHQRAGTFGCHVRQFELLTSTGERLICSPTRNTELFQATIGGLGLTGVILWAEVQLKPIGGPSMTMECIRFAGLEEFFELSALSDKEYEYTVAWVDCLARGERAGRGIFIRGNHAEPARQMSAGAKQPRTARLPFDAPAFVLNRLTVKAFNAAHYYAQSRKTVQQIVHYETFFYPLDAVQGWNRLYGKRGFLQYQCVVPHDDGSAAIRELLARIARSGLAAFLAVLKIFGSVSSPGMLSFPRPGVTLAVDFPYQGARTLRLLDDLDEIVLARHGAIYPAKDARMSARIFHASFPRWKEFMRFIDPKFSSSFWRRVAIPLDADR